MTSEKNKVILHIEDEPAHATIIRIALQRNHGDINLRQVEDGVVALDYLCRRGPYADPDVSPRPDLMLLDLRMPQLGGFEVLAIVKKDPRLQTIPIVIMTTSDLPEDRSKAHTCGANGYLTKPDDFDEFVRIMNELCVTWL